MEANSAFIPNVWVLLKFAALLAEKPIDKQAVMLKLAISNKAFYRKVYQLNKLGIQVRCERNRYYISNIESNILKPLQTILTPFKQPIQ